MKLSGLMGAVAALAIAAPASAAVLTIDFDTAQAGYTPTPGVTQEVTNQYGSMGVVFHDLASPGHGGIVGRCGPGVGTGALFGFGADFAGCGDTTPNLDIDFVDPLNNAQDGYTTYFSIHNYDGLVRATAYDSLGAILGTTETPDGDLTFSGIGNISRVNLLSLDGDPTTMDTLQFETVVGLGGAVPEPAVWAMMIVGFGLVGSTLRARRHASVAA